MAPRTRLNETPSRRVSYTAAAQERAGTHRNPIVLDDAPVSIFGRSGPQRPHADQQPREVPYFTPTRTVPREAVRETSAPSIRPRVRGGTTHSGTSIRVGASVRAGTLAIPGVDGSRVTKSTSGKKSPATNDPKKKKGKEKAATRECSLCASTKSINRSFTSLNKGTCSHFKDVCNRCVRRMVKTQTLEHRLSEATLACPFPNCESVLDYESLKIVLPVQEFELWDKALATHLFRSDDNFIACLSTTCGKYFSRESCQAKRNKREIECPYCKFAMCLTCTRPWHPENSCNKEKNADNAKSEAAIRTMGAKPCPKCSVIIEKHGGCDHMTCQRCRHNFCWDCLVAYTPSMVHGQGCRSRGPIADDPGNWMLEHGLPDLDRIGQIIGNVNQVNDGLLDALRQIAGQPNREPNNNAVPPQPPAQGGHFNRLIAALERLGIPNVMPGPRNDDGA